MLYYILCTLYALFLYKIRHREDLNMYNIKYFTTMISYKYDVYFYSFIEGNTIHAL